MCWLIVLFLFILISSQSKVKPERHYMHYMFTAWTKAETLPVISAVGVVDDRQISDDSNEVPDWMRQILTADDRTHIIFNPDVIKTWFMDQLYILSNCRQCSELHTFQRRIGCEVEPKQKFPNGTVTSLRAFDEYGFDGEDLIVFDYNTMLWIEKSPKAKKTKKKWDKITKRNLFIKIYVKKCMDWISTFNNTHENSPVVRVFARKAPDDHSKLVLICLVTGFYPRDIEMNIRLNKSILDNQTRSGIRPNDDETFQMRSSVEINCNYRGSYDCHVIHSSLTEPVTVEWGGKCSTSEIGFLQIVIPVIVAIVSFLAVIGIFCWCNSKKKGSNALGRTSADYGAVSQQTPMTSAVCTDASDQEISVDGSTDQTEV